MGNMVGVVLGREDLLSAGFQVQQRGPRLERQDNSLMHVSKPCLQWSTDQIE